MFCLAIIPRLPSPVCLTRAWHQDNQSKPGIHANNMMCEHCDDYLLWWATNLRCVASLRRGGDIERNRPPRYLDANTVKVTDMRRFMHRFVNAVANRKLLSVMYSCLHAHTCPSVFADAKTIVDVRKLIRSACVRALTLYECTKR